MADDDSVRLAEKEAAEAEELLAELERASLEEEPANRPSPAQVAEQRELVRFARGRVAIAQQRAADAREDARLKALHAIGARAAELARTAGSPDADLKAAVQQLAELAASIRARAGAHDETVKTLYNEAARLAGDPKADPVGRTGQPGPWAAHMPPQGVKYGNVEVHVLGGATELAIDAAVKGDVDGALKRLVPVKDHTPARPTAIYRDKLGQFPDIRVYGSIDRTTGQMLRDGRIFPLSETETNAWTQGGWQS